MKSKNNIQSNLFLAMGFVLLLISGCNKEENTPEKVTDIDGNVYTTVTIGTQVWMVENLKTTKYNNGIPIPNVTSNSDWGILTSGAYAWYENNQATYKDTYGALYNWYAVNTGNLCPTGWRVPTDAEWTALTDYVGGASLAGTKLKATSGWENGGNGTDDFGFSARPGGYRDDHGDSDRVGYGGTWWSSTEYSTSNAWGRDMYYNGSNVYRGTGSKSWGFSVRCLRD